MEHVSHVTYVNESCFTQGSVGTTVSRQAVFGTIYCLKHAPWQFYYEVLQCVAVCCSVLQRVAVCRSVPWCVAVCCSVLQCVAVYCSVSQCVAECCSELHFVIVCGSVLQCVAVCHIVLNTIYCLKHAPW